MLESLLIKNIVLIDKLHLNMERGLCVLTGETGSGKSILLDALGLAIGYRSSSRLLRSGEKQGSVVAEFNVKDNLECHELLKEQDIDFNDSIILRRILYDDGRSKAYVNDIPVSQNFLNAIGNTLLEVHGQSEQSNLLRPSFHGRILDEYGDLGGQVNAVVNCYKKMRLLSKQLNSLLSKKEEIVREQDYLQHILNELETLDVKVGEEEELNNRRIVLMNKEKVLDVLNGVRNELDGPVSLQKSIASAQGVLNRSVKLGENLLDNEDNSFVGIIDSLEKASIEINEALEKIDAICSDMNFAGNNLEEVEERLFAIRGLARKFSVKADYLLDFTEEIRQKLQFVEGQEILMGSLKKDLEEAKENYLLEARKLSEQRKVVGKRLAKEVMEELNHLKMDKTVFDVEFKELAEENWSKYGLESVRFIVSTNPGMPMDDLSKIASGGELSRFMLALKVVLSKTNSVPTIIFDEIDAGIGGSVAHAVGERLRRLGKRLQVMVVTHHPQVASKGSYHLRVRKDQQEKTNTFVDVLQSLDRKQEIARMLAGDIVTDEALLAAERLLEMSK